MPQRLKTLVFTYLGVGAAAVAFTGTATAVAQDTVGPVLENREKQVMDFATSAGRLAGAAEFCRVDEDMLSIYLSRVDSRLAQVARDDIELVVARSQFKNIRTVAKGKPPEKGCSDVRDTLNAAMKALRETTR